jgi:NAD-dependent deacetylase
MAEENKRVQEQIQEAARKLREADYVTAFTGAGISVESGIPPFRGENGLWSKYDPSLFHIDYFKRNPAEGWQLIKDVFYATFKEAEPNAAHRALAEMEKEGFLQATITQNIDNLHHKAGSEHIIEYHGNSRNVECLRCGAVKEVDESLLREVPPRCSCGGLLKPQFIFFGEPIPGEAVAESEQVVSATDVMILIGTTGVIYPAAMIPQQAAAEGSYIIEVNPAFSDYTNTVTNLFIQAPAAQALPRLREQLSGG